MPRPSRRWHHRNEVISEVSSAGPWSAPIACTAARARCERDPNFGTFGRRTFDFGFIDPGIQLVGGLARDGSRLLFAGLAQTASGVADAFVGALESDTLFAYGME